MNRSRLVSTFARPTAGASPPPPPAAFFPSTITGLAAAYTADPAYCFQDAAKATPCADGDPVYTWADRSGAGLDFVQATLANRPLLKSDGAGGYYVLFDGSNDFMSRSPLRSAAPMTLTARLWPTGAAGTQAVFIAAADTDGIDNFDIGRLSTERCRARQLGAGDTATASSVAVMTNAAWNSVAGVFTSNSSRSVFVNGTGKVTNTTVVVMDGTTTLTALLGRANMASPAYLNGRLSSCLLYSVALTDQNIADLNTNGY
jgi:hypothetical protein